VASGVVERVNAERGKFCVLCDDGSYAYFRVLPDGMPKVGDRVSCPDEPKAGPAVITNLSRSNLPIQVRNALARLPREVAFALLA